MECFEIARAEPAQHGVAFGCRDEDRAASAILMSRCEAGAARGHFWGFLETRPYMRARHKLALTLLQLGEEAAAMGIRCLLLGCLLRRDDIPTIKALLADHPDEWSVYWLYTRTDSLTAITRRPYPPP